MDFTTSPSYWVSERTRKAGKFAIDGITWHPCADRWTRRRQDSYLGFDKGFFVANKRGDKKTKGYIQRLNHQNHQSTRRCKMDTHTISYHSTCKSVLKNPGSIRDDGRPGARRQGSGSISTRNKENREEVPKMSLLGAESMSDGHGLKGVFFWQKTCVSSITIDGLKGIETWNHQLTSREVLLYVFFGP